MGGLVGGRREFVQTRSHLIQFEARARTHVAGGAAVDCILNREERRTIGDAVLNDHPTMRPSRNTIFLIMHGGTRFFFCL